MITELQKALAIRAWNEASEFFNFKMLAPYTLTINGVDKEVFAFIDGYGSPNGTLVNLTSEPDFEIDIEISEWAEKNNVFVSFINVDLFQSFDKNYFTEILKDWRKY